MDRRILIPIIIGAFFITTIFSSGCNTENITIGGGSSKTVYCEDICSENGRSHSRCAETKWYEPFCSYNSERITYCTYDILDLKTKENDIDCGSAVFDHCICYNYVPCGDSITECNRKCKANSCAG